MLGDKITAGTLIGLLADGVKLVFNYLAYKLGYAGVVFWRIVAAHFVRTENLYDPLALVIGAIADLATAASLGIVFLYFLSLTGRGHVWLKGVGFGLLVWVFLFGIVTSEKALNGLALTPLNVLVTPIAHLLFGLALALLAGFLHGES